MRKSVRKFMGVAVLGVLAALFVLPMAGAGAQEDFIPGEGPPPAPECTITSFEPSGLVAGYPVTVTVQGTTDQDGAEISLFAVTPSVTGDDVLELDSVVVPVAGPWVLSGDVQGDSTITVGIVYGPQNAYAAACANEEGVESFTVESNKAGRPAATPAAQLAFTGSSETPSYVLIGIAAIVVGAVLVVAARRRSHLS